MCFHKWHHNLQYWNNGFGSFWNACDSYCFVHSLAMTNVLFTINLALHFPIGTLIMAYISFKTCLVLTMVYIFIKMCMTFHVPFGTLAMVYILVKMRLPLHIPFRALAMAYILIKMCLTFYVHFRTLDMAYIPFQTCLALVIVNIFIKMYLAHNNTLDVF